MNLEIPSFTITYRNAAYYVSIPNYNGGEVVPMEHVQKMVEEIELWKSRYFDACLRATNDSLAHRDTLKNETEQREAIEAQLAELKDTRESEAAAFEDLLPHKGMTLYDAIAGLQRKVEHQNNWIDVDVEMPHEEDKDFWCHVEIRSTPTFGAHKPYQRVVKTYRTPQGELRFNCGASERVTYWSYLPEPPCKEAGWISTTEKMPTENAPVLGYTKYGYPVVVSYDDNLYWRTESGNHSAKDFITHWRPLPQIPKHFQ